MPEPSEPPMPAAARNALTLADLEAMAVARHPVLKQAAMNVRASQGKCVQEGLYPNPMIGYEGDEMGDMGKAGKQGGYVSQEIVTGGKLWLGRAVVGHETTQRELEASAYRLRVINGVRLAFYEVLAAQRIVEISRRLCAIGDEGVRVAEQLFEVKEAGRVDALSARIEADSARLRLQAAKNRHERAWRRLAHAVGESTLSPSPLQGDLESPTTERTWDAALQTLLESSPELARARAGVQRARCELARQCAQRVPNVSFTAGVQHDNSSGDNLAKVGIGIPLPLFNRNQGNIAKAEAELVGSQHEVERVELELRDRLAGVFQAYADSRQQATAYRDGILPKAKTSLELVRKSYEHGEVGYVALLMSQRTYFDAGRAYWESLLRLRSSEVLLEGLLIDGMLRESPSSGSAESE